MSYQLIRIDREIYTKLGVLKYQTGAKSFNEIVRMILDEYTKEGTR